MLRHIAIWTLNDAGDADRFATALRSCRHLVPGIREFDVGVRRDGLEADGDVVLVSTFDDEEAFSAYLEHPHHRSVVIGLGTMRQSRVVFDFVQATDAATAPAGTAADHAAPPAIDAASPGASSTGRPAAPSPGDFE